MLVHKHSHLVVRSVPASTRTLASPLLCVAWGLVGLVIHSLSVFHAAGALAVYSGVGSNGYSVILDGRV